MACNIILSQVSTIEGVYSYPSYETIDRHAIHPISCNNIRSDPLRYNLTQDDFTWCLYILNDDYDIHSCFNATHVIYETPAAAILKVSEFFKIPMHTTGALRVINFDQILHKALLSCSVDREEIKAIHFLQLLLDGKRNFSTASVAQLLTLL